MSDIIMLTCPWRIYNGDMLRAGELPFWNPHLFCGYPHLATLQSNALYPPVAMFDLWDPIRGIGVSMALHLALAGSLMFSFLRRTGLGVCASTFGALVFEFNGFFLVRMGTPSYVYSGIWVALMLLAVHEIAVQRRWQSAWKLSLAVSMAVLGGHPQIVVLSLLVTGGYLVVLLWPREVTWRGLGAAWRPLMVTGCAVLIGMCLVAFQLLPFLELVAESGRQPILLETHRNLGFTPAALIQAVVPDFFGHPVDGAYWLGEAARWVARAPDAPREWGLNYCGENVYLGLVPLVFVVVAIFRDRSRVGVFFFGAAVCALLVMLATPLLDLFWYLVPTFRHSRADRVIFLYMVSVPILAARGFTAAEMGGVGCTGGVVCRWLPRVLMTVLAVAVLWPLVVDPGWTGGYQRFFHEGAVYLSQHGRLVAWQGFEAVVCALAGAVAVWLVLPRRGRVALALVVAGVATLLPMFRFGWRFNPMQKRPLFPVCEVVADLGRELGGFGRIARLRGRGQLVPNTPQILGLHDANGSSAAALRRYVALVEAVDPRAVIKGKYLHSFRSPRALESGLLDLLAVRFVLSSGELPLPEIPSLRTARSLRVYRNPGCLDRFFLVAEVETYDDESTAVQRLFGGEFDPRSAALVKAGACTLKPDGDPSEGNDSVRVTSYAAHRVELEVHAAGERLLVSSEPAYPGWRALVDGARAETILVNLAFRGVVVPPGAHEVEFRFFPLSFYRGLAISLIALILLLASQIVCRRLAARRAGA